MTTSTTRTTPLAVAFFVLSGVGLVGTWWFNLSFMIGSPGGSYLGGWFANGASSSAAVDIIVVAIAACVLFVVEGRRLGWSGWGIGALVVFSFVLAVAFTFPLFLGLRERTLAASRTRPSADIGARAEPTSDDRRN